MIPNDYNYELGGTPDFAPLVLIRVYGEEIFKKESGEDTVKIIPRGFVFIKNKREFGSNAKWKLVSEHPKRGETPLQTAVRGLLGETHLSPPLEAFSYAGKWLIKGYNRPDHWQLLFTVDIKEDRLAQMDSKHSENEGEVGKFFTMPELVEVVRRGEFMSKHYKKLVDLALILPPPEAAHASA